MTSDFMNIYHRYSVINNFTDYSVGLFYDLHIRDTIAITDIRKIILTIFKIENSYFFRTDYCFSSIRYSSSL